MVCHGLGAIHVPNGLRNSHGRMLADMDNHDSSISDNTGVREETNTATKQGSLAKIITFGLVGVVFILLMASRTISLRATEEIVGFVLIVIGMIEFFGVARKRKAHGFLIAPSIAIAAGFVLLIWPGETLRVAGLVLGAVIVARGIVDLWGAARKWHETGANSWIFIRGLVALAAGAFVLLNPQESVEFVVIASAILAIARAILSVSFAVTHRDAAATIDPADTTAVVTYWLTRRELGRTEAEALEQTVFLFRSGARKRLWRFGIFMALSTAIATFGIATDSTAVVIGAMLIAPFMAPILGVSAGLINGRLRAASLSALIVFTGVAGTIVLSWLLSAMIPNLEAVIANSEVTSRTAPSLLDLAIAIAAGAAGAYGVSRIEVSDALPGVAVSIALVPPLAVVGITLYAGDYSQASGALLLFLTNLFSIVLMAGLVFLLVGYGEWSRLYHRKDRIRTSFAVVALGAVLIAIPLTLTGRNIIGQATDLRNASDAVVEWLGEDSTLRINEISVSDGIVNVQLIGPKPGPPPSALLSGIMAQEVGRAMTTRVAWVEEQVLVSR